MELGQFTLLTRFSRSLSLVLAGAVLPLSASADFNLGVSSTNYLGQGSESRQGSYSSLDLRLDSKTVGDVLESRAFAQAQIGLSDAKYRFVEFPELYLATSKRLTGADQYFIGRKRVNWSDIDQTWGAGAFEPRFRWDYLRPEKVGLLGAFYQHVDRNVRVTLFASPLFIPDRGAPLDFSDGRIHSISPWVVNPPYRARVLSKDEAVRYDAKIPSLGDIVLQNSAAAQVSIGGAKGFWGSTSYSYKPMNQLLMGFDGFLPLSGERGVSATLYPRVAYHHLAAADVGYRGSQMSGSISFLADIPKDDFDHSVISSQPTFTSQQVGNFFLVSPTLRLKPFGDSVSGGDMSLSYLHVFGEDLPDQGELALSPRSKFDSRYPFKNAFLFSAQLPKWRRLSADLKLLVDFEHPGTIVSWNFNYAARPNWNLFLATDVLTSFSESEFADGTDFIGRYRENDRVTGGVSYVF